MGKNQFSKYEYARILGARALQIAMDAPILIKTDAEFLENIKFDPLRIAEAEIESGVLPISVNKPLPKKIITDLEKIKIEEDKISDEQKIKSAEKEVKEIAEQGEIMEMANPEDEREE